jgi:transposase
MPCSKCAPLFEQQETKLKQQDAKIRALEERLAVLEDRSRQNSSNSSKPPSSDGYNKPAPKSLRSSSGRRSGGQNGHPGRTLKAVAKPDHVMIHPLQLCLGCDHSLGHQPILGHEKRQVFDLPDLQLIVTEHQAEIRLCPYCGRRATALFPPEAQAPTQYGPRLMAWWAYLRVQQLLSLERIAQMTFDLFGIQVSEATLQSAIQTASSKLEGFEAKTKDLLQKAKLAHADETGLRVDGQLHWLHNLSTRLLTWYGVHRHRGRQAIEAFGILRRFRGRLIHDCWASYFALKHCLHGLCNAHLLRELTFIHEVQGQPWAGKMCDLLVEMHQFVTQRKAVSSRTSPRQRAFWQRRYRGLLREGWAANPARPPGFPKRGRPKQTKAQNLLNRLQCHQNSVLAFLYDFRVPFTNNLSEQDLRMMKVQQKISGAFRTSQGAQVFARIRSYVSTVRKNQRDVFREMVHLFQNKPFIPRKAF